MSHLLTQYRKTYVALIVTLLTSGIGFGATAPKLRNKSALKEQPTTEVPEVNVSPGLAEKVYKESITASLDSEIQSRKRSEGASDGLGLSTSARLFQASSFVLQNNYFSVPYDAKKNWLGFATEASIQISEGQNGQISTGVGFSYFYYQDIRSADADVGISVQDAIELQWLPIQTSLYWRSPIWKAATRVGFGTGVSLDYLSQSGQLDGMSQTFLVPRYELGPELTAFANSNVKGFDGLHLAARYTSSFASSQTIRGWLLDAGAHFAF